MRNLAHFHATSIEEAVALLGDTGTGQASLPAALIGKTMVKSAILECGEGF